MTDLYADLLNILSLQDYNTRLVVISTLILGIASGILGSFLLLRKTSLLGDTLSHSCLSGICIAFAIMASLGFDSKNLYALLFGALLTGLLGVGAVVAITKTTKVKADAAMAIVLSVSFGLGVVVLSMVQQMQGASAAGLENFIYGKTASMVFEDFVLLSTVAIVVIALSLLLLKEFTLLSFDVSHAKSLGIPVVVLELAMILLVTLICVVGLQAVGIILIIAFLIIPVAAARFWTQKYKMLILISAFIGGLSAYIGSALSALLPKLPAGAVIVLCASCVFVFSMIFGAKKGVLKRLLEQLSLKKKIEEQYFLRTIYEMQEKICLLEDISFKNMEIDVEEIVKKRTWHACDLERIIKRAKRANYIEFHKNNSIKLSDEGFKESIDTARDYRIWEAFLLKYPEIASNYADRDVSKISEALPPRLKRELEAQINMPKLSAV